MSSITPATIKALARFGTEAWEAVPTLVRLLDDDDEEIAEMAAAALADIDPERFPGMEPTGFKH